MDHGASLRSQIFKTISLTALLGLASAAAALTEQTGTTAAPLIKLGGGARAIGMGGAYVALSDDSDALSYNPAGLLRAAPSIQLTHSQWFQGLAAEHFSAAFSLGDWGSLGFNANYLQYPTLDVTERTGYGSDPALNFRSIGSSTSMDSYGTLGYARKLGSTLLVGAGLKLIGQNVAGSSATGVGLDLGIIHQTQAKGLTLGIAVQNIGYPMTLGQESFELPRVIRAGASYQLAQLLLAAELDLPIDNLPMLGLGFEYDIAGTLYPRFGFRSDGIHNPWTAGLGFKAGPARIDLATQPFGELGSTYRISLSYYFAQKPEMLTWLESPKVVLMPTSNPQHADTSVHPNVSYPDRVALWGLYIFNARVKEPFVVRKTLVQGKVPEEVVWDQKLQDGSEAEAGTYQAVVSVKYDSGQVAFSNYYRLTATAYVSPVTPEPTPTPTPEVVKPKKSKKIRIQLGCLVIDGTGSSLKFCTKAEADLTLKVYAKADPEKPLRVLEAGKFSAGEEHQILFDLKDADGKALEPGTYVYALSAERAGKTETKQAEFVLKPEPTPEATAEATPAPTAEATPVPTIEPTVEPVK